MQNSYQLNVTLTFHKNVIRTLSWIYYHIYLQDIYQNKIPTEYFLCLKWTICMVLSECRTPMLVCLAEMIEGKTKYSMVMDVSWVFVAFLVTIAILGIPIGTTNFYCLFDWLTNSAMHFPSNPSTLVSGFLNSLHGGPCKCWRPISLIMSK